MRYGFWSCIPELLLHADFAAAATTVVASLDLRSMSAGGLFKFDFVQDRVEVIGNVRVCSRGT